jgi:hypothetical protein
LLHIQQLHALARPLRSRESARYGLRCGNVSKVTLFDSF